VHGAHADVIGRHVGPHEGDHPSKSVLPPMPPSSQCHPAICALTTALSAPSTAEDAVACISSLLAASAIETAPAAAAAAHAVAREERVQRLLDAGVVQQLDGLLARQAASAAAGPSAFSLAAALVAASQDACSSLLALQESMEQQQQQQQQQQPPQKEQPQPQLCGTLQAALQLLCATSSPPSRLQATQLLLQLMQLLQHSHKSRHQSSSSGWVQPVATALFSQIPTSAPASIIPSMAMELAPTGSMELHVLQALAAACSVPGVAPAFTGTILLSQG